MNIQYFLSLDALISAIVAVLFGVLVISKNKKSRIHQTLFLLAISTAFWLFGYWKWLSIYDNAEQALFWTRILSLGSLFIPIFYFHWISTLLGLERRNRYLIVLAYGLSIFFSFFSFSPLFVSKVEPVRHFTFWPKAGWLYSAYLLFVYFGLVLHSLILLIWKIRSSYGLQKIQLKYVLYGSILGFGGGATNFFLWYNIDFMPIGNLLVILYVIVFSYAIIVHRFLDIKLVLRKSTVVLLSLLTIFVPAILIMYVFSLYFPTSYFWSNFFILVLGVLLYPSLRVYYFHLANRYFFSSLYDSAHVISEVSNGLKMILETEKVYSFIYSVMVEIFHVRSFGVLTLDQGSRNYVVRFNRNIESGGRKKFARNEFWNRYFAGQNKILVVEEARNANYNEDTKDTLDLLAALGIEIVVPLSVKDRTIGLFVLGPKESGDMYNDEDLQVLESVGAQTGVALNNAQLYTEVMNFNVKLRKKVDEATSDLRENNERLQKMSDRLASANDQLRRLDNAKSEFISIASHQLRTPLTAIKGFVSLLLEGSYGGLSKEVRETLDKVYLSNERLIALVEDLLNLSRIESGRLEYKFEKTDLVGMCQEIYDTFVLRARERKLKFEFKKPEGSILEVTTDRSKLREVVSNLVDNAIKYTPEGGVTLRLEKNGENMRVAISDTGIGVPKEEIPYLFQKFSRGKDINRLNTGGTGLGLHVGKKMIEALHGRIWLESEGAGKGSTFFVELPLEVAESVETK